MLALTLILSTAFAQDTPHISCVSTEGQWYDFYKQWGELHVIQNDGSSNQHFDGLSLSYAQQLDSDGEAIKALYLIREEGEMKPMLVINFPIGSSKGQAMLMDEVALFCTRTITDI